MNKRLNDVNEEIEAACFDLRVYMQDVVGDGGEDDKNNLSAALIKAEKLVDRLMGDK